MVNKLKIIVARLLVKIRNFQCECECESEEKRTRVSFELSLSLSLCFSVPRTDKSCNRN